MRPWRKFLPNFSNQLSSTSGVVGIGGLILAGISFAGVTAATGGTWVLVAGGIGIALASGSVISAATRAIPAKLKHPSELIGKDLGRLDVELSAPVFSLAIVGTSQTGKSTLTSRILQQPRPQEPSRTEAIHSHIATLQVTPSCWVRLFDGPGDRMAAQFRLIENAQIALILVDHNESDSLEKPSVQRLQTNKEFQQQLRHALSDNKCRLRWIHLMMNKRDLWERGYEKEVEAFFTELIAEWKKCNLADQVTHSAHSNNSAEDIAAVIRKFTDYIGDNTLR